MPATAGSHPRPAPRPTRSTASTSAVNGLNQYTDISGAAPDHDDNGNLVLDQRGRSFGYDAENVLRTASGLAAGTATYRYHADGTRRARSYNGTTTRFYYMGGLGYLDEADTQFAADQEIAEYSSTGALLRRYIRLPGSIDETFLMIDVSGGTPVETWAHADRIGSVIATTDGSGTVQDRYRYSPYGRPGVEGPSGFPFRFTGQKLDPETGLYYYKARYYDPETGRFLQTDPIGYDDQMNLYAYVGNDPVNAKDPHGECTYGENGNAISGICPAPGDGKAAELINDRMGDKDSITSDLDGKLEDAGLLAEVSVDETSNESSSVNPTGKPTMTENGIPVHSGQPQGSEVVIRPPGTIDVISDDGIPSRVTNHPDDVWEHEMSHVQDNLEGLSRLDGGPVHIEASGAFEFVPGEGRAVNRTNDFRNTKKRGYQRSRY